jgi:hypothetical protein
MKPTQAQAGRWRERERERRGLEGHTKLAGRHKGRVGPSIFGYARPLPNSSAISPCALVAFTWSSSTTLSPSYTKRPLVRDPLLTMLR